MGTVLYLMHGFKDGFTELMQAPTAAQHRCDKTIRTLKFNPALLLSSFSCDQIPTTHSFLVCIFPVGVYQLCGK